jgi:hypothetical protein
MRFSDSELLDCEVILRAVSKSSTPDREGIILVPFVMEISDKKKGATLRSPDSIYGLAGLFLA